MENQEIQIFQPITRGILSLDSSTLVRGSAAVYYDANDPGTECQPYPDGAYERLAPGCFDAACLKRSHNVIATFDHKQQNLLGRTPATLRLHPGPKGLDFELDLPDTTLGRDVKALLQRGDIGGCSFTAKSGFATPSSEGGKRIVTIRRLDKLTEVSLVINPYYTSAQIKRGQDWHELVEIEAEKLKETQELIRKIGYLY